MQTTTCTLNVRFTSQATRALYESGGGLSYATEYAAGMDLRACLPAECDGVSIGPGERYLVPSGIAIEPCTPHTAGFVYSRSGLGAKQGLVVAQGVGVIDADYRGEIMVMLLNTSGEVRFLARGERMAQLVIQPVMRAELRVVDALGQTERGDGGFGHTGKI